MKEAARQSRAHCRPPRVKTLVLLLGYLLMASLGACGDDKPVEVPDAPAAVPVNQVVTSPVPPSLTTAL